MELTQSFGKILKVGIMEDKKPILIKDLGMRYPTESSKQKKRYGLYQCQYCREEFEAQTQRIKNGNTKSCGCQSKGHNNPHGLTQHRLYSTWNNMVNRCNNSKITHYKDYGERGIKVCDRWLRVENFIEDMYPSYQEGLTLDRIDVNGNYEPDNCRWATLNTQARNTRKIMSTNKSGFRGVSGCVRDTVWRCSLTLDSKQIHLGYYQTALEAGKAYERYVRLNNLEHNFTPALTEDEIEEIENLKSVRNN